jgi:hypothetical protein
MGEADAVRALVAELAALRKVRREIGPVPLDIYFQEVTALVHTIDQPEVRATLEAVGLSPATLDMLPLAQVAARDAHAAWAAIKNRSYSGRLVALIHRAHEERDELLAAAHFHLGTDRDSAEALSHLAEGHGLDSLVHDLLALWRLIDVNAEAFTRDKTFHAPARAQAARELALELQRAQREERLNAPEQDLKEERDRSYTYLVSLVDEIRRTGRYAFRNDTSLLVRFNSSYERTRGTRRRVSAANLVGALTAEPTLVRNVDP